jgi:hypothetical protein
MNQPIWVSEDGRVDTQVRANFFRNPLHRIRAGFNSDKYKQLLEKLQDDVSRIATLTSSAIALESLRLDRKRRSDADYWNLCRKYASHLYATLNTRWSVPCSCQCSHQANLQLLLREEDIKKASTFSILFSCDAGTTNLGAPWDWRAVDIEASSNGTESRYY